MAFTDTVFNTSGKIPTESNFWNQSLDQFVTSEGITAGFRRVIGEQVFKPLKDVRMPFYQRFAGAPITAGSGWTERALKYSAMDHWNPKATAEDDLKFYDSDGIEKTFEINVRGTKSVSVPSLLESPEMFVNRSGVGTLNSMLVDNVIQIYQRSIESEIQKKAISLTKAEMTVDVATDGIVDIMGDIMDKASEMLSDDYHYNELSEDENANLITRSSKVYLFMNQAYVNAYRNAKASLPSPGELVDNVELVPMVNALAKPITTAEFTAGPRTDVTWATADKPVAVDKPAPIAFLCGSDKVVYRPVEGSYKVNLKENGKGDFVNEHLIYKGAIAVRPWENSVRINLKA